MDLYIFKNLQGVVLILKSEVRRRCLMCSIYLWKMKKRVSVHKVLDMHGTAPRHRRNARGERGRAGGREGVRTGDSLLPTYRSLLFQCHAVDGYPVCGYPVFKALSAHASPRLEGHSFVWPCVIRTRLSLGSRAPFHRSHCTQSSLLRASPHTTSCLPRAFSGFLPTSSTHTPSDPAKASAPGAATPPEDDPAHTPRPLLLGTTCPSCGVPAAVPLPG